MPEVKLKQPASETIVEMRKRHKREVEEFQAKCNHPESTWMLEQWAIAHFTGYEVRVCKVCGKILERRQLPGYPNHVDYDAYLGLSERLEELRSKL